MAELNDVEGRVGTTVGGQWHLDALVGMGGTSSVYAATHTSGRRAAFKILHRSLAANAEVRARFLEEERLALSMDHPDRVHVEGIAVADDGALILMMELLEGETLSARWRREGQLAPRAAFAIVLPILDQLAMCHRLGIIHRDLKPENVFLGSDGRMRLLDFGVARGRAITTRRVAMGTPTFMPPEQARGQRDRVDARSDIFAVGAMLWSLLSGFPFRRARSLDDAVHCAAYEPIRSVSLVVPDLSRSVVDIIDRALQAEPRDRWPTALAMKTAIEAALPDLPDDPLSMPEPSGDRPTLPSTPTSLACVREEPDDTAGPSRLSTL